MSFCADAPFRGSEAVARSVLTRSRLRGPGFRRLFPDVYVPVGLEMDHVTWCRAALLYVCPAAISGPSAAALFGVTDMTGTPIEVTVSPARRVQPLNLLVVRSRLTDSDLRQVSGLMVTTPERTVFDLARRLGRDDAVVAIDAMLHRHLTTADDCAAYALDNFTLPGSRRVIAVLHLVDKRSASPMESRLRLVFVDAGLPRPESQVDVRDATGGLIAWLDFAYRDWRIGIEYDGDHHRDRSTFRRDIARMNALAALGWTIIRVTADDIRNPANLIAQLTALIARVRP